MGRMHCALESDSLFRQAQKIKWEFNRKIKRLRLLASVSGERNREFNIQMIEKIIEKQTRLSELGYRTTDAEEGGQPDRLVRITDEWLQKQLTKQQDADTMGASVRRGETCVGDMIRLIAREE